MLAAWKKMVILNLVTVFFVVLDRWFKAVALKTLAQAHLPLTSWLKLNLDLNQNIAFSLPLSGWFLKIITLLIIAYLLYLYLFYRRHSAYLEAGWLFMIIVGAISNLLDRFKYGAVVDYLDVSYFTTLNLADVLICCGAIGLIWQILNQQHQVKTK